MFNFIIEKIKMDWWEVTHLGFAGYIHFFIDWVKYLVGANPHRPIFFNYSEIEMDLDFDFSKDEDKRE